MKHTLADHHRAAARRNLLAAMSPEEKIRAFQKLQEIHKAMIASRSQLRRPRK